MRKLLMILSVCCCFVMTGMAAPVVLDVPVPEGDATPMLRRAIEQASSYKGRAVLIRLQQGDYHIYRTSSSPYLYYISNTASAEENPDPTKHIGIWLKDMKNITVDGGGARFVTHGEMTPFVIDGCENVTMKNFSLVAADPSVPEMTVVSTDVNSITARVTAGSDYEIEDGTFYWYVSTDHTGIGVAVSDRPEGPYKDALGKPLLTVSDCFASQKQWACIDPTVLIDDDGQAWIFWGNGECYYARLKENMIEIEGEIRQVNFEGFVFEEAPWVHKRGDKYYLSYASGFPERIAYAMADSIEGPWVYQGILNEWAGNSSSNHQAIQEYKGRWYFFYHNGVLKGGTSCSRSVCADYLYYNADGTMRRVQMTSEGVLPVVK